MTLCNMSIEAGAQTGIVAPDDTTFAYLDGRANAPKGAQWDKALAYWQTLPSDHDAGFDQELNVAAADIAPTVSWGTSPEQAASIDGIVPDPRTAADPEKRQEVAAALDYMGLTPGMGAHRYRGRSRLYRLMHQCPDRGPARRRRSGAARPRCGADLGGAGIKRGQAAGRGGGDRSHLSGGRLRMA